MEKMTKKKVLVFLDVSVDGDPFERMIFELFTDVAPKTAENFRALCTGEKGASLKTGKPLHYKGTFFHRIIKGYVAQGGDFLRQNGKYGESIYGGKFPDESPKLRHDGPGLLSMAIADRDERGSLFSITFEADHHLDRKNIVFGKLVEGDEVLKKIENAGDDEGRPAVLVKIVNSGEIHYDAKEGHKLKSGKEAVDDNNHKVKRKGKHKKLSKKRKRRRRYYTSESDSSTDTDTDSSESDTDSDSSASSLSDTSSSADDKRKRKRSKRDRHRHGKRKNKRHDKRHKRRDKKSKRKSKRNSVLDSESDSETGSGSHDDGAVGASNVKHKLSEVNQSLLVEQETPKVSHKKGEGAEISEREEREFPRENGDHQSNGIEVGMGSEQSASRHHYGVNDCPSKSRSRSLSPERTTSKSMRISPRTAGKGPGVGTNSRRSPSISRSPQQISGRSRSNTPVRSGSSRSPAMSKRRRSVSMSPPARSPSQRSRSRSATVSPPRRRVTRTPPRISSKRSSLRSASRSPPRSSRPSLSRSSGRPSRRTISRSPVTPSHRSVSRSSGRALPRRSPSRSPVRSSHRSVSRSSGRAPPRRSPSRSPVRSSHRSGSRSSGRSPPRRTPSRSPVRAPRKINRRSYSGSPVSAGRRERSPVSDRGRSSSRSPSVDGSPKRVRRGRGFSDRFSYVRRYRSRSPDRSPVRSYRYGGRSDRDRYSSYRRSPRRYRSPLRARTPPRFRGRRSRTRTPSVSRSPIRYRNRRYSRSPIRSRSPVRVVRRRSPSRSRSPSESRSLRNSRSPKRLDKGRPTKSSSGSPPPRKTGLVSYGDGSPDSDRN